MQVGFVQTAPAFGEVAANLERALVQLEAAEGELLVLPELFATGYRFLDRAELEGLAEPVDGPTVRALTAHCRARGRFVVAGFAERAPGGVYNSACVAGPAGLVGIYRKVHLFFDEKRLFLPGDLGFPVWDLGPCRLGVLVCFDWCFPEAARSLALAGAQVIAHPANLVLPHAQGAMVTRCLENRVFVVTANRVGTDDRGDGHPLRFTGGSQVACPDGTRPRTGTLDTPCAAAVEIDPVFADDKWITPANHVLRDRRPAQYRVAPPGAQPPEEGP
ncbi:MAG: nitrilase-related carbon-nitrogen hydrolase [Pseudomonadota bacterium]